MSDVSQAVWGILAAILSSILVFGGLVISLTEVGAHIAAAPTSIPTLSLPVSTLKPGEPTYTPSPTALPTDTPTVEHVSTCNYPAGWEEIPVQIGDTLDSLASSYNVSVAALRSGNCMNEDGLMDDLYGASTIYVPVPAASATSTVTDTPTLLPPAPEPTRQTAACIPRTQGWIRYVVKPADNLYRIGITYRISYQVIMARNCLDTYLIRPGQIIYVPNVPPLPATNTPVPYYSPTPIPPVITSTSVPPTAIPPTAVPTTGVPATVPPVSPTSTVFLPSATPVPPSQTAVPPMPTFTQPPPRPTLTPVPTIAEVPTSTPVRNTPPPPLPTATLMGGFVPTLRSTLRISDTPETNISSPVP